MQGYSNTGDTSTLEALIMSCVNPVERMAYKYCGDFSNHDDFVSIGMLKVCEVAAHAQVNAIDPLAYLCKAAQRAMIDEYNRLHRISVVSLDAPLSHDGDRSDGFCLADLLPDRSSSPAATPTSSARARALNGAIRRVSSARQRAALRRWAGLPGYGAHDLEETARSLHTISRKAAQSLCYHGRRNLRLDARLCRVVGVGVQA